ncbi:unnamed protein product [Leptidea sinapis]|uniref:FHA domain-containing protein n=1 Tax=Leptidea sinapis TaxID=189913 RepID=A0A5E4Q513_9NEOP|nr:unnamed protein product [Leptidea sinapis]
MFHVRRRPTDSQPRRRKKKAGSGGGRPGAEPALLEVAPDGSALDNGRRVRITDHVESRHCVITAAEGGGLAVTPLHADAHVFVNGRRVTHATRLQHGCLLKFGRVSTFRFIDPAQENLMNRNLAQSQNYGSGSIYDRSAESGAMSPTSLGSHAADGAEPEEFPRAGSPLSHDPHDPHDPHPYSEQPYNNNTIKLDSDSVINESAEYAKDEPSAAYGDDPHRNNSHYKDNYETTFDLDGNVETKSICSAKSGGSGHDNRSVSGVSGAWRGQEPILPAVLEFPEAGQAALLAAVERCADSAAQAFWMANSSELLHFLKCDRHISSFSTQAQELLPTTVQNAFSNLVQCFQEDISRALVELTRPGNMDPTEATAPTLQALASAMVLLRRCRVRALLAPLLPPDLVDAAAAHARALADELYRADGREITLEENEWLGAALLIPGDGFSAEVVRGVPPGLAEFVAPLQRGGLCRLAHQPHAIGLWTVYMHSYGSQPRRPTDPRPQIIQLHKNSNGMGLSIVAAKAAEYLVRTGPTVTLEVAKQGAVLHGLATLLHQPTYTQQKPGYGRKPQHRCHLFRNVSSESSTEESEELQLDYHRCIPRVVVTLDKENYPLRADLSSGTPSCPAEVYYRPVQRQIPIFTITCEDDEKHSNDSLNDTYVPETPPPVPDPPTYYELDNDETCLPPQMKPINTRLMLDLCNSGNAEEYRRRCTSENECVSACECCRTPQPEAQTIPYIDEPSYDPVITEGNGVNHQIATPKIRRILPSLSLDKSDQSIPKTADAECQTPPSPSEMLPKPLEANRNVFDFKLNKERSNLEDIRSRLRRTLSAISTTYSSKSEDTDDQSTYSCSESRNNILQLKPNNFNLVLKETVLENNAKNDVIIINNMKSWKSPDEYRPGFGKVKALTKRFNEINLSYCVKNYKRNCKSSPNLCTDQEKRHVFNENLQHSTSLADLHYERSDLDSSSKNGKMTEDEVKSILIQLEDWSKFGSRGSEDTLAQGNEFELPNLPSEEHTDTNVSINGSLVFNEIVNKKPRIITLDNIKLKSNPSMSTSKRIDSTDSCISDSTGKFDDSSVPRMVGVVGRKHLSSTDVSTASRWSERPGWSDAMAQSCPDLNDSDKLLSTASLLSTDTSPFTGTLNSSLLSSFANQFSSKRGPLSPGAPTAGWSSRSRSSHNLSGAAPAPAHHDSFYQNLSSVHALQDRWSSLRSSGSGRPQSAHFGVSDSNAELSPSQQHQINQASAANARAAKLAEMSEEVNRRQQQHLQQQQQQQHLQQNMPQQYQKSPVMPQMFIHTGYGQGVPNAQSMQGLQNVGMNLQNQQPSPQLHGSQYLLSQQQQQHQQQQNQPYHNQHGQSQRYEWHQPGPPSPQRSQPPVAPKPQGQRKSENDLDEQSHTQMTSTIQPDEEHYVASALEPPAVSMYGSGPAGARGVSPAPHNPWQREERERQAEARRAAARARRDATIGALVALGSSRTAIQNQQLRALQLERDFERRATQHDPDDGGNGEGSQEDETSPSEIERPDQEKESRLSHSAQQLHIQTQLNSQQQLHSQMNLQSHFHSPINHQSQIHSQINSQPNSHTQHQLQQQSQNFSQIHSQPHMHSQVNSQSQINSHSQVNTQSNVQQSHTQPQPPKSILKTNTRNEIVNGYPPHVNSSEETRISELSTSVSSLSVGGAPLPAAPPPPERGSSFAVMAGRRALSPSQAHATYTPQAHENADASSQSNSFGQTHAASPTGATHSGQAGPAPSGGGTPAGPRAGSPVAPPAPPASSPPPLDTPGTQHREDPDRFIEEAESMLYGASDAAHAAEEQSPGGTLLAAHTHTPGVIGAQEVYR